MNTDATRRVKAEEGGRGRYIDIDIDICIYIYIHIYRVAKRQTNHWEARISRGSCEERKKKGAESQDRGVRPRLA